MKEIKPPNRTSLTSGHKKIFLAGSIEMGTAENWQSKISNELNNVAGYIFNPRRDDWDSSWVQELNNPQFFEQVSWELDMLFLADVIIMYFDPNTKSPISLLELGLYASSGKLMVCCPDGFWRKGNVDIVCQRYSIPLFTNIDTLMVALKNRLFKHDELIRNIHI
jgi:hypothetical protein